MRITVNPPKSEWANLLRRPQIDAPVIGERVAAILERVRAGGDRAVLDLTAEIDSVALDSLEVAPEEIERAEAAVSPELKRAIATAAEHIERFHAAQRPRTVDLETAPGVRCLQRAVPIRRVGLYVPGGSAPLFSTVLMLAVPARVAGCEQIVLCTPPQKDGSVAPAVLYAASIAGVRRIFKAGGAQAIGAMAYGTQSIPRVDKIFGPGNQYVTAAKQQVASICRPGLPKCSSWPIRQPFRHSWPPTCCRRPSTGPTPRPSCSLRRAGWPSKSPGKWSDSSLRCLAGKQPRSRSRTAVSSCWTLRTR